ncbi:MAG TPA: ATP synthase F1 subunit epsilon [Kiritimatiellia bacterium]|nr:ATP synthase F1 subunit epsilon [Kiritimatiellia bacterium]
MLDLNVILIGTNGVVYSGPATSVGAPGKKGNFGILADHAPMISELEAGLVRITNEFQELYFLIDGGFCEVCDNEVAILVAKVREVSHPDEARELLRSSDPWKASSSLEESTKAS